MRTEGQRAAERPAGLAERRSQPAPCHWCGGAPAPCPGLVSPGLAVRSRPSPQPALRGAVGRGCGLGSAGCPAEPGTAAGEGSRRRGGAGAALSEGPGAGAQLLPVSV